MKKQVRNRMVSALGIGFVLLAMVPFLAGCPPFPEAPPAYLLQWGSVGNDDGKFNKPYGVAVNAPGNLVYVTDWENNRIQKFDGTGVFQNKWGSGGTLAGEFDQPQAVAVDAVGNVYVADTYNSRIQKFTSTGGYLTQWGSYGSGNGQFNYPNGLAVDATGNVYVADTANHRIQKFGKPSGRGKPTIGPADIVATKIPVLVDGGTINVYTYLDGTPWTFPGLVSFSLAGPQAYSGTTPQTYTGVPVGSYSLAYNGGSYPTNASFVNITSSATQAVTAGSTTTFTINFSTRGTINIYSTLDGVPWTVPGTVKFDLAGPQSVIWYMPYTPVTYTTYIGTYTLSYLSGTPPNASFVDITPSATQTVTTGGNTTVYINFKSKEVATGRVAVNATLDGVAWTVPGTVNFSLAGPQGYSGTTPQTYTGVPVGSYTLTHLSGGPPNATFVGITPSATQAVMSGATTTYTLEFRSKEVATGRVAVYSTLDGVAWTVPGTVSFSLAGPQAYSGTTPQTYTGVPVGSYTLTHLSGTPPNASFVGITSSATQAVTSGGTTVYYINFRSKEVARGTIVVNATLDGAVWQGGVNFTLTGPQTISGASVPFTSAATSGSYTLTPLSSGPPNAPLAGITSSATQTLTSGGTITFTLNYKSREVARGTVIVNATLDGAVWQGGVNFTLTGPQTISGTSVPFSSAATPGSYAIGSITGGPSGAILAGVTPTGPQTLTYGGTITYTLNYRMRTEVRTGTIIVNATWRQATGIAPWTGAVSYTLTGAGLPTISGTSVSQTYAGVPVGTYTIGGISGGPPGTTLSNTTPSATQTLTSGGTITFTLEFR